MQQQKKKFAILIATKNRIKDLTSTLKNIEHLLNRDEVECIVFDDGSIDGTSEFIKLKFSQVVVQRNEVSKGYIYCRNKMLNETNADFAISLDDDAHFLSQNPLEIIEDYFSKNANCGLLAFRIFWGKNKTDYLETEEKPLQVKSFVGCGHTWRMDSWRKIPNYPEWFVFYGEEEFASCQLFKKNIEIHYLPQVLVQHRVDILSRKTKSDYRLRLRRSLRSGWYLYFLFYPINLIPKFLLYTVWIQVRNKTLKGDFKATIAIIQAISDVFINLPRLITQSNRLSSQEYQRYCQLPNSKIYWKPKDERKN